MAFVRLGKRLACPADSRLHVGEVSAGAVGVLRSEVRGVPSAQCEEECLYAAA